MQNKAYSLIGVFLLGYGVNAFAQPTSNSATTAEQSTVEPISAQSTLTDANTKASAALSAEDLGRILFFDPSFSMQRTQSCSTCHDPGKGFADSRTTPAQGQVSLGDDGHSFGTRNAPTASYAAFVPDFHYDDQLNEYVGGLFLDGRAKNLAEQAGGPPVNPLEMGMPNKHSVVARLKENPNYVAQLSAMVGEDLFDYIASESEDDNETFATPAYNAMTEAIAAFERTEFFSPFDSKYDKFLRGEYELTVLEDLGRSLFFSESNVNCATCHKLYAEDDPRETFTNHQYRNIGVPSNTAMIKRNGLSEDYIDHGLLENPAVDDPQYDGKFRTPTLRNVAVTGPYMHNGVFKDLRTVIEFYDHYNNPQRYINPETGEPWRAPEVADTVDLADLKAQALTDRKIDALVAFLKILTDERYEHLLD